MSSVVVCKSPLVMVRPSEPVTAATGGSEIPLSTFDQVVTIQESAFLVFEDPIHEPAETIRRGLSQALVHYYPIAGRLATGATSGKAVIKCTGEGVSFVAASANCAIKDVADSSSLKEELAVYYPSDGLSNSEPLMLVQVTVFSCGGFILGLTWYHLLCDGVGLAQFMRTVGELARGLPSPSVVPVRSPDSLMLDLPASMVNCFRIASALEPSPRASQNITLPSSLIHRIRSSYSMSMTMGSNSNSSRRRTCSVFEAVAAVLWRCRTRAIVSDSDPDTLVVLSFTADARKYASAKKGFYGNCVTSHLVVATSGMVANGDVLDLVKMIQIAKVRMPDQSTMDDLQHRLHGYNLLSLSSWQNFAMGIDFGAGEASRLMSYKRHRLGLPICAVCVPCKDELGVVMANCVREEHADAFLHEISNVQLISAPSKL